MYLLIMKMINYILHPKQTESIVLLTSTLGLEGQKDEGFVDAFNLQ